MVPEVANLLVLAEEAAVEVLPQPRHVAPVEVPRLPLLNPHPPGALLQHIVHHIVEGAPVCCCDVIKGKKNVLEVFILV